MQITVNLDAESERPIIMLDWFMGCRAMIDTGAVFPVWPAPVFQLLRLGGRLEKRDITFSGFGGQTKGDLYRVDFRLGSLVYKDMPIVTNRQIDLNCHMILSATMFEKMAYVIDNRNHYFSVDTFDNQTIINLRFVIKGNSAYIHTSSAFETEEGYNIYVQNTKKDKLTH